MILLKNDKVAKFLGMTKPQMYKLMTVDGLPIGLVSRNPFYNKYFVYKDMLEKVIGRELTENEVEEMRKRKDD
ncbi:MAG: hypothetical protein IJ583_15210 [Firmicutes bacterium]|nr:hypothetical protein [Bacillota bacterium]